MTRIIGKSGSGHVEFILSMVIFVGFLITLLALFPVSNSEKSRTGLDIAKNSILKYSKTDAFHFSVILNKTFTGDCFSIPENLGNNKTVALNQDGEIINATSSSGIVYLSNSGRYYDLYYSAGFEENSLDTTSCLSLPDGDVGYEKGLRRELDALDWEKVVELGRRYSEDYENLKREMSIPRGENFGFIFYDSGGVKMLEKVRTRATLAQVIAENVPVKVVYRNGTIVNLILNVQIW